MLNGARHEGAITPLRGSGRAHRKLGMAESKSIHSAASSAAGYLYQARLALVECLKFAYADSGIEAAIEKKTMTFLSRRKAALWSFSRPSTTSRKLGDLSDTTAFPGDFESKGFTKR